MSGLAVQPAGLPRQSADGPAEPVNNTRMLCLHAGWPLPAGYPLHQVLTKQQNSTATTADRPLPRYEGEPAQRQRNAPAMPVLLPTSQNAAPFSPVTLVKAEGTSSTLAPMDHVRVWYTSGNRRS